jgi:histidinol dehydrogenase
MNDTLERIDSTDPMLRMANHSLMVAWINYDLLNRAHHDVGRSVVLYDSDKMFMSALPQSIDMTEEKTLEALEKAGVRFWSWGIV